MKKIGIYVNKNKDKDFSITKRISSFIEKQGFECQAISDSRDIDDLQVLKSKEDFLKDKDCVIVLGGDGTILRIASVAAKMSVPILSVNLGHLGFLTELELEEIEDGIKLLKNNDFTIERRMMLSCRIKDKEYLALNDVCLQRASRARLLKFKAYAGNEFIDALSADGVLISSPTGSTAYSLSAGGPIVSPKLRLLLMTPICAHTLRARPIVFAEDEVLRFESVDKCGFAVVCDGVHLKNTEVIDAVEVSKSQYELLLVNFKQKSFFARLQNKFIEWNINKE